jgi:hypothetical protein
VRTAGGAQDAGEGATTTTNGSSGSLIKKMGGMEDVDASLARFCIGGEVLRQHLSGVGLVMPSQVRPSLLVPDFTQQRSHTTHDTLRSWLWARCAVPTTRSCLTRAPWPLRCAPQIESRLWGGEWSPIQTAGDGW